MRKILILTTATGEGHNQAAKSLKEILKNKYDDVEIFDFLQETKATNDFIVGGYELTAKVFPAIYGICYKLSDLRFINRFLENFSRNPRNKTLEHINTYKPDIIACTHPLAVCILGSLTRKGLINVPTVSIITDFRPHYTYFSKEISAYITGSEFSKRELISLGINENKIFPVGIPVNQKFYHRYDFAKEEKDYFNILLMGGSMGLSGLSSVLKEIVLNKHKLNITIVCGKNEELKKKLKTKYEDSKFPNKHIKILGFTNTISELMDSMDLIITKPGGLTTTESIHKSLPMLIPFVIPGQETENAKFLCDENAAIRVKHTRNINAALDNLLDNPAKLKELRNNMQRLSEPYSIIDTIRIFDDLCKKSPSK